MKWLRKRKGCGTSGIELVVATSYGVQPCHRSQFRRTTPAEPGGGRLEAYGRTDATPRCRPGCGRHLPARLHHFVCERQRRCERNSRRRTVGDFFPLPAWRHCFQPICHLDRRRNGQVVRTLYVTSFYSKRRI